MRKAVREVFFLSWYQIGVVAFVCVLLELFHEYREWLLWAWHYLLWWLQ